MINVDINILKTFIEVASTRHFGKAANRLYLTQAAVSARIKLLEEQLGIQIFSRERNNIRLTRQGEKLLVYATQMIDLWHKATQEVCAPEDYYDLSIAAPRSIWSSKLSNLPHALFERYPKLHLTIDSLDSDSIVERMAQRTLDFGFIYEPPKHSDLDVEQAFTLEMGLYSAQPQLQYQQLSELKFVCIDLGKSFRRNLSQWVPNLRSMVFQAYDWEMVASYLLEFGGYGLLPKEWVERNQLPLHPIEDTEAIRRPVYLCRNIKVVSDEIRQEFLQDLQELL